MPAPTTSSAFRRHLVPAGRAADVQLIAVDSPEVADRKAQYAAWRDRLRKPEVVQAVEPEAEAAPSLWSTEALFDELDD